MLANRLFETISATEADGVLVPGAPLAAVDAPGAGMTGWARRLGHTRHGREDRAARLAQSQHTEAAEATEISVERWVAIVAAIRGLAEAYNAGARRLVLSVVEPSGQPAVTVAAGGEGAPYLTATLEDACICMRAMDAVGTPHAMDFRLRSDRSDDATAAYLLQNWMQHL